MADASRLLAQRNARTKHKPDFIVKEAKFKAGVKKRWRYPRGKHSDVRQRYHGHQALPTPGYGAPKAVYGLDRSGVRLVVIRTLMELQKIIVPQEAAVFAATLGMKRRLMLLEEARLKKIPVFYVPDISKAIENIRTTLGERKKKKAAAKRTKQEKEEVKKKAALGKEKAEQKAEAAKAKEGTAPLAEVTEGEVEGETLQEKIQEEKEEEKKEMEKTITKRQ